MMAVISGHTPPMKAEELTRPTVPVAYALLILETAAERDVGREALLAASGIAPRALDNVDARLSLVQIGLLLYQAMRLTKDPALGYAIGLRSNLTTHGFIGYGVMSHRTLREAVEFGLHFLKLRLPNLRMRLLVEDGSGVLDVTETTPQGAVRQCMFDLFLVGIARMAQQIVGPDSSQLIELWFDYPQPAYYPAFRERLPRTRFAAGANQIRFPAAYLDRPLATANAVTASLVKAHCERELAVLGFDDDFPGRVRATLVAGSRGYPDLDRVAAHLGVSARTLKRRLLQHGLRYSTLLEDVRRRDSIGLLADRSLSIEQVALRVGYSDPANFTRAFRKWTGASPSAYRSMQAASVAPRADPR